MSHITGGGLLNIPRINSNVDYHLTSTLEDWSKNYFDEQYNWVQEKASLSIREMLKTFNCGIGLVIITDEPDKTKALLKDVTVYDLGVVKEGKGRVILGNEEF